MKSWWNTYARQLEPTFSHVLVFFLLYQSLDILSTQTSDMLNWNMHFLLSRYTAADTSQIMRQPTSAVSRGDDTLSCYPADFTLHISDHKCLMWHVSSELSRLGSGSNFCKWSNFNPSPWSYRSHFHLRLCSASLYSSLIRLSCVPSQHNQPNSELCLHA